MKKIGEKNFKKYYPRNYQLQGVAMDLSAKNQKFIKNTLEELFLGHCLVLITYLKKFWIMEMLKSLSKNHQNWAYFGSTLFVCCTNKM